MPEPGLFVHPTKVIAAEQQHGDSDVEGFSEVDMEGLERWFERKFGEQAASIMKLVDFARNFARVGHEGHCVGTTLVFSLEPLMTGVHLMGSCPFLLPINFLEYQRFIANCCLGDGAVIFNEDLNLVGCWQRLLFPKEGVTQETVGGMRHKSAIAMTEVCKTAVAICVSDSGGEVSVFHEGQAWLATESLFTGQGRQDVKLFVHQAVIHTLEKMIPRNGIYPMLQSISTPEHPGKLFQFHFDSNIEAEQFEKISQLVIQLCEQGLRARQVQTWLEHPELRLHRGTWPIVAPRWFAKEDMMVGDMKDQTQLIKFEQAMRSEGQLRSKAESTRLLNEGSRVAAAFPPSNIKRGQIEVKGDIILHIKGGITPSLSPRDKHVLQNSIVQEILDKFGEVVTLERLSPVVVHGSEKFFQLMQAALHQFQHVEVAGFTIDRASWGKDLSFSLCASGFSVHQVFEGLHEYVMAFQAEKNEPKSLTDESGSQ